MMTSELNKLIEATYNLEATSSDPHYADYMRDDHHKSLLQSIIGLFR